MLCGDSRKWTVITPKGWFHVCDLHLPDVFEYKTIPYSGDRLTCDLHDTGAYKILRNENEFVVLRPTPKQ